MRIAKVELFPVLVPYRRVFTLGNGATNNLVDAGKPVLFVRLETESGLVGWGEQRAEPRWSYETIETMMAVIKHHLAPIAIGLTPFEISKFHERADAALSISVSNGMPFARAAIDIAFHDLAGKIAGLPLHKLLGGALSDEVALCSAIGVDTSETMVANVKESSHYSAYKIKISGDIANDARRLRDIAAVTGSKPLWLDANQSYAPGSILRLLDEVSDISSIICVEQPVRSPDWAGMATVRQKSRLPVAVDEGCFTAMDLAKIVQLQAADMAVLKICKSGGVRKCMESAIVAKANGLELLGSGLTDCGIAFAAAVHLFSTMNLVLPAELNGPEMLQDMLVTGLEIKDGIAKVPSGPGLGVEPKMDLLNEWKLK